MIFFFSCLFCHTGETDAEEGNLSPGFSMEKLETHSEVLFTRKRADSLSLYTIDTAELEGLLTRPDEEVVDRMIDEEISKSGRVRLIALLPFQGREFSCKTDMKQTKGGSGYIGFSTS